MLVNKARANMKLGAITKEEFWSLLNLSKNGMVDYEYIYLQLTNLLFPKEFKKIREQKYQEFFLRKDGTSIHYDSFNEELEFAYGGAKYFFVHSLILGDINSLDVLLEGKTEAEKERDFAVLLFLLQQYSELYYLTEGYSNSEFWELMTNSNLTNPVFECFHYVNFFRNMKEPENTNLFKLTSVASIYKQCDIGKEEVIQKTMVEYILPIVEKILHITNSNHFDKIFKEFFSAVKSQNEDFMKYVFSSIKGGGYNILYKKLVSLGFAESY